MWVDDGFGGSFTLLFSREERNNKEKKSNTKRGFEHERNDKEKKKIVYILVVRVYEMQ